MVFAILLSSGAGGSIVVFVVGVSGDGGYHRHAGMTLLSIMLTMAVVSC